MDLAKLVDIWSQEQAERMEQNRLERSLFYHAGCGLREMALLFLWAPQRFRRAAVDFWMGVTGR